MCVVIRFGIVVFFLSRKLKCRPITLSVVLYGRETWFHSEGTEAEGVCENKCLRRIFGPKGDNEEAKGNIYIRKNFKICIFLKWNIYTRKNFKICIFLTALFAVVKESIFMWVKRIARTEETHARTHTHIIF
jgi:hypothetical protein